jgi:phosphatidylglycerol:prolipoprotein diacylglycerol transferase
VLQQLVINIPFDPNIGTFGPFQITWHGVFTALGIAVAVILIAYFGRRRNIVEDDVYNIALWSVPAGIVGARLLYVLEHFNTFKHDWGSVFSVNEGGISIYGALIGGALVGFGYAWRKHLHIRRISDAAALGLAVALAVGRMGDLVNGEHWAKASNLPWAFCYTNPNTLNGDPKTMTGSVCDPHLGLGAPVHPVAGLYEPLILLGIFAVLWYLYRRLSTAGYIFWIFVLLYAAMRFALAPLRLNETQWNGVSVPQVLAGATVVIAVVALYIVRRMAQRDPENAAAVAPVREARPSLAPAAGTPRARRT